MPDYNQQINFKQIIEDKPDDELLQLVYEFDKWNPDILEMAEEELRKRNLLPADIQNKKQEMISAENERLTAGKQASKAGLVIGWLTCLGLLGIFIGYNYAFSKTTGKFSGQSYYRYNEQSRKRGTALFYTSILLCSLGLIYRLVVSVGAPV